MGAPDSGMHAAEQTSAEALLSAFKTIDPSERRKHASVLNYWLSIRGDKEFPPLHDLDPLEISDAGANSVLLELISGGHDAEVRHIGEALRTEGRPERIIDAASPSVLASIAKKLPIVAISRDFLAFEDEFATLEQSTRCWVTLLPLSGGGAWVDYVYGLISLEVVPAEGAKAEKPKKTKLPEPIADSVEGAADEPATSGEAVADQIQEMTDADAAGVAPEVAEPLDEPEPAAETADVADAADLADAAEPAAEIAAEADAPIEPDGDEPEDGEEHDPDGKSRPGFSKLFDNLVGLTGFYGHGYKVDPTIPDGAPGQAEPVAEAPADPVEAPPAEEASADELPADEAAAEEPAEPAAEAEQTVAGPTVAEPIAAEESAEPDALAEEPASEQPFPAPVLEGPLQTKLTEVRAKADEARQAKLRANAALYDGLSAAYDFALDAEDAPEEYLRLVEAEGLKIQLRSPMRPVVKLAFDGMCDDSTIRQLEAVLAWALDNELPRGSLAEQIEAAGGIGPILTGDAKAA
ncbi:MAG TPA: hypothetical protein VF079_03935 [Sphingomicrobium sp.]